MDKLIEQFLMDPSARNSDLFILKEKLWVYCMIFEQSIFLQVMFCPHVPGKIITLITSIWANCALKRFFSSMCTNMSLHYTFRFGKLCTNWTSK